MTVTRSKNFNLGVHRNQRTGAQPYTTIASLIVQLFVTYTVPFLEASEPQVSGTYGHVTKCRMNCISLLWLSVMQCSIPPGCSHSLSLTLMAPRIELVIVSAYQMTRQKQKQSYAWNSLLKQHGSRWGYWSNFRYPHYRQGDQKWCERLK